MLSFRHASASQAYWPFHRDACKRNEFADVLEASQSDPKFAQWMRDHGKRLFLTCSPLPMFSLPHLLHACSTSGTC